MKIKLTDSYDVFNGCKPYLIAEVGSNHNGDMELASEMIKSAKVAGADCVKFQSWTKNSLYSKSIFESDPELEATLDQVAVSEEDLRECKKIADNIGIDMISTPFSEKEADFLVDELKVPFMKVASMDLNNYPLLEYVAKKGLPIVLATGLGELHEIDKAVKTIENAGNSNIILLHCISMYPPEDKDVNLNNIDTLMRIYPYPIGFSDHTLGFSIALAASAKGACVIEKHFTTDKTLPGCDQSISIDPDELDIISRETKRINDSLGEYRIIAPEGPEKRSAFRRSLVAARDIKGGAMIDQSDITQKRPGHGIPPGKIDEVIGRKVLRDISADDLIRFDALC